MGGNNTFILCLGAQKAGTSWLHKYLNNSSNANMGFAKEYHIFDAAYSPFCARYKIPFRKLSTLNKNLIVRYAMQKNSLVYLLYFRNLISNNVNVTGDITPSYSILNAGQLRKIKYILEIGGFNVKVIFLMRDPVARCWSATKMRARKIEKTGKVISESDINEIFKENYSSLQYQYRTKYELILNNINDAFSKSERLYLIYEELFTDANINKLSQFTGTTYRKDFASIYFNSSHAEYELHHELKIECKNFYRETYRYCNTYFPQTKKLWLT